MEDSNFLLRAPRPASRGDKQRMRINARDSSDGNNKCTGHKMTVSHPAKAAITVPASYGMGGW